MQPAAEQQRTIISLKLFKTQNLPAWILLHPAELFAKQALIRRICRLGLRTVVVRQPRL
jgi:hypothetical protein